MEKIKLIGSFLEFKDDENVDKSTLKTILEESFRSALKREFGTEGNFDIIINSEKGDLEVFRNREVVADADFENKNAQIALSEAQKIESDVEVGEEFPDEISIEDLGRRFIRTFRQTFNSKKNEYDNTIIYKNFKNLIGDVYTAEVHLIKRNMLVLMDDKGNELILPRQEQIKSDFFRKGDTVKGIVKSVELRGTKSLVMLSRTDPRFLEKLFEQEIPEIFDGLITIRGVARVPGEKAKVAVDTYDDRVDPVGACVGMRGSRIHGIVRELGNENIDVVNYTENQQLYISRALSPAKVSSVEILKALSEEEKGYVKVILKPEEVSRAIGRRGTNIRLASMLTGYEIDVQREGVEDEDVELIEFSDEIERWVIDEFLKVGMDTAKVVLKYNVEELERRTDLEKETIQEVINILQKEFER